MANGEICGSTHCLEIDHIVPRAAGGPSTVENCRILCDGHNDLSARRFFGDGLMDRYTRNPRAGPPEARAHLGRARGR
jgi:5-methylcytosine-specific restriction endonuclease McrA